MEKMEKNWLAGDLNQESSIERKMEEDELISNDFDSVPLGGSARLEGSI